MFKIYPKWLEFLRIKAIELFQRHSIPRWIVFGLDNLAVFANFTNLTSHIDSYYIDGVTGQLPTSFQSYGLRGQFGVVYNF